MTVSILLFAWYLFHRSPDTGCCRGLLSNLCGINGRAAVCLARSAVPLRGGVRTVALLRAVDGDAGFVDCRESGPDRACAHGTAERLRGGRPRRPGGARRVLGLGSRLDGRPAAVRCARRSGRRCGDDTRVVGFGCRWDRLRGGRRLEGDARSVADRRMRTVDGVGRAYQRKRHVGGGARHRRRGDRWPVHHDHDRSSRAAPKPIRTRTPSPPIWATMWRSSPSSPIRARRILHSDRISRRNCS